MDVENIRISAGRDDRIVLSACERIVSNDPISIANKFKNVEKMEEAQNRTHPSKAMDGETSKLAK